MDDNEGRRRGVRSLFLLAAASAGLLVFAVTAGAVISGSTQAFDRNALSALRHPGNLLEPIGPDWLLSVARDVTALGGTPLLTFLTLLFTGYFAVKKEWRTIAALLVAVIGETILSSLLKDMFGRPRPDIVPHLIEVSSKSFPSGHATSAAAIYLTLAALLARDIKERAVRNFVYFGAVSLAALVGASRVYLGVHYPTDVIGGLGFGAFWAAIVLIAARRLEKR